MRSSMSLNVVLWLGLLLAASCILVLVLIQKSSEKAVLDTAYDGAKTLALAMNTARTHYSESSVSRIRNVPPIHVGVDYRQRQYGIPNPATFAIELGEKLSADTSHATVRMFSNYPFPGRQATGGPRNAVERFALTQFDEQVREGKPVSALSQLVDESGEKVLYYIKPIVMTESCVACHNSADTSPKRDWQLGDVRGAISIRQVLVRSMALQNMLNWGYLGLFGLWLCAVASICFISYRTGRAAQLDSEKYLRIADTDSLTKLLNRRGFDRVYKAAWKNSLKQRKPIAILYCDIDNFKKINDEHGHAAGDECLKDTAKLILSQLRSGIDMAARWGGDELLIILWDTNTSGATAIAHRISNIIKKELIQPEVSMSIGVASMIPDSDCEPESLLQIADAALYQAKASSGGMVCNSNSL